MSLCGGHIIKYKMRLIMSGVSAEEPLGNMANKNGNNKWLTHTHSVSHRQWGVDALHFNDAALLQFYSL